MRTNTYKEVPKSNPKSTIIPSESKWIKKLPNFKFLSSDDDGENSQYIPKILFVTFLGILYIANGFQAEKSHLRINKLEKSVEKLRVEYSTLKYDFINESKRSKIEKRVAPLGLIPLESAPIVISVSNLEDN